MAESLNKTSRKKRIKYPTWAGGKDLRKRGEGMILRKKDSCIKFQKITLNLRASFYTVRPTGEKTYIIIKDTL